MFLKSLTLKGFKSFAETTTLELEPGISVVVGPNGSGKSNVVDAIGWVLGAQAPSAVRGQRMDDVIFAGTESRPALGRAEVSLTIDNGAGLLPIEFSEVTLRRTLFRSGDSEYAINGVPCRLLDIQELLSDTGVGRQQHVIVSQGQIDAVLNARPEERRLIIEEAAGVLKYRRRKEKAERRLAAAEANLTRIHDLLREVRRQLRPLERQADAARRHGDVTAELTALRRHLAGRELTLLRRRLADDADRRQDLATQEAGVKASLAQLDRGVLDAESQLSSLGADDLGDLVTRFESLRERARGLVALTEERGRGLRRDLTVLVDRSAVVALDAEAEHLHDELDRAAAEAAELAPRFADVVEAEGRLVSERETLEHTGGSDQGLADGRAAEVRGDLAGLRQAIDRAVAEADRVQARRVTLDARRNRFAAEHTTARTDAEAAARGRGRLRQQEEQAAAAEADAERRVATAEAAAREAAATHHAWSARAEALAQAASEHGNLQAAEHLYGVPGVLGPLADLVDVDAGYEVAFEVVAADAQHAVVVDGADTAKRALAALRRLDLAGALLVPVPQAGGRSPTSSAAAATGAGHDRLRAHVRSPEAVVEVLLDELIGDAVVVAGGWEAGVVVAVGHPGTVVVTRSGDRLGPRGWRVGAAAPSGPLAVAEAQQQADSAAGTVDTADADLATARAALEDSRRHHAACTRSSEQNEAAAATAAERARRMAAAAADAASEWEALGDVLSPLVQQLERDRARAAELARTLPVLENAERDARDRAEQAFDARRRLEERAAVVVRQRTDLEVRVAGLAERRELLERRLADVDARRSKLVDERERFDERKSELECGIVAVDRLGRRVRDRLSLVEERLSALHDRRRRQSEAVRDAAARLDGLRRQRSSDERTLEEVRERARRAEVEETETRLRLEGAVDACRRDLDCEPEAAMAAECPPLADGATAAGRVRELERELRLMGPVNPLALEEFAALEERHTFLQAQLDDVKATRRDLAKVIRAIDEEIVNVFAAAFAGVSENFSQLFETLFPGGRGHLRLTDPENLLDTGIEVEARPSGKNVRKLSLLSGGERSLTALAYLFAVFRSCPSPFYVMDEVEAALDDVNLHRFLELIHEFRDEAQLIVVSHQKRTMEAADCLYGVTMAPGGSSRVISERVSVG